MLGAPPRLWQQRRTGEQTADSVFNAARFTGQSARDPSVAKTVWMRGTRRGPVDPSSIVDLAGRGNHMWGRILRKE